MKRTGRLLLGLIVLFTLSPALASPSTPDPVGSDTAQIHKTWIENMKASDRGPFYRIRWFCNDGSIRAPKPYACSPYGGGYQHGQWNDNTEELRNQGIFIANIFAGLDPYRFFDQAAPLDIVKQMIMEQFLIQADDGWIFRKARYYRGALQNEDETRGGAALLKALFDRHHHQPFQFLMLREAARLLPHHYQSAPVAKMRQLTLTINQTDPDFHPIRVKIHVKPEASDAAMIRNYAKNSNTPELQESYAELADTIDRVFYPKDLSAVLKNLAENLNGTPFSQSLFNAANGLSPESSTQVRLWQMAELLAAMRTEFARKKNQATLLSLMNTSLVLEDEVFRLMPELSNALSTQTVGQTLKGFEPYLKILFGTGLISDRQYQALSWRLKKAMTSVQPLTQLRSDLLYLTHATDWADRNMGFHFSKTMATFEPIEPIAARYIHDRLHSNVLLLYSRALETLMAHNSYHLGIHNTIFGTDIFTGVSGLNPGLAKGVLREPEPGADLSRYPENSILILPATTADLPPVAGIITAGKGNSLSHVQLLARNLGIPNVAVDLRHFDLIRQGKDKEVVLAVSAKGVVNLDLNTVEWAPAFETQKTVKRSVLKVDMEKLNLDNTRLLSLAQIRSKDSGRVSGPKAANLGELKYFFPTAVTKGVIIPFSIFRNHLEKPFDPSATNSISMFDWMKKQYQAIEALQASPDAQKEKIKTTLARIRQWILTTDPGEELKANLKEMLETTLGPDGSYGVFVRSDTNVEDLPGFTGAGLNKTVPNVVGFEGIYKAILKVWASPFSLRSYSWRHRFLENPEHVYASVLLMKTVPVEKSGVMVTKDLATGKQGWLTIAVNEGVGGAVAGQTAEEILVQVNTGDVTLLAQSTEPIKRIVHSTGGMGKIASSGSDTVLQPDEIKTLIDLAIKLPDRFPILKDDAGNPIPADVEFGFLNKELVLFQIRPLVDDAGTLKNDFLIRMDQQFQDRADLMADLSTPISTEAK